jgi:hypothetical protein
MAILVYERPAALTEKPGNIIGLMHCRFISHLHKVILTCVKFIFYSHKPLKEDSNDRG